MIYILKSNNDACENSISAIKLSSLTGEYVSLES
jgi:hypothetical protein